MKEEKIIFYKKPRKIPAQKTPSIRVSKKQFRAIAEIADDTNLSLQGVTIQLIEYALKHVEIKEIIEYDEDQ